mmetsp:Transcript_72369/g.169566  ORF Transcript_72369/g.169566 Transcript_72369/m.169566 type:complete len:245 (-) Transcript_72369:26-760(-)
MRPMGEGATLALRAETLQEEVAHHRLVLRRVRRGAHAKGHHASLPCAGALSGTFAFAELTRTVGEGTSVAPLTKTLALEECAQDRLVLRHRRVWAAAALAPAFVEEALHHPHHAHHVHLAALPSTFHPHAFAAASITFRCREDHVHRIRQVLRHVAVDMLHDPLGIVDSAHDDKAGAGTLARAHGEDVCVLDRAVLSEDLLRMLVSAIQGEPGHEERLARRRLQGGQHLQAKGCRQKLPARFGL